MSVEAINFVMRLKKNLTPNQKLVLLVLANEHNSATGICQPTLIKLAGKSCMAKSSVIRILKLLEENEFIEILRGSGKTNGYTIRNFGGKGLDGQKGPDEMLIRMFEDFWSIYPRKQGKHDARKAFVGLKPSQEKVLQIIEHIHDRLKYGDWSRKELKFIPHASTFIRQRRFEDPVEKPDEQQNDNKAVHW